MTEPSVPTKGHKTCYLCDWHFGRNLNASAGDVSSRGKELVGWLGSACHAEERV